MHFDAGSGEGKQTTFFAYKKFKTTLSFQEKSAGNVQQLEDKYPQDSSVCLLDKSPGVCKARFRRFYFNKETKACEPFFFSGKYYFSINATPKTLEIRS